MMPAHMRWTFTNNSDSRCMYEKFNEDFRKRTGCAYPSKAVQMVRYIGSGLFLADVPTVLNMASKCKKLKQSPEILAACLVTFLSFDVEVKMITNILHEFHVTMKEFVTFLQKNFSHLGTDMRQIVNNMWLEQIDKQQFDRDGFEVQTASRLAAMPMDLDHYVANADKTEAQMFEIMRRIAISKTALLKSSYMAPRSEAPNRQYPTVDQVLEDPTIIYDERSLWPAMFDRNTFKTC